MIQLLDPVGLRLHGETQRSVLRATMEASRRGSVRRPVGSLLVGIGRRLAPEATTGLRPAADCP